MTRCGMRLVGRSVPGGLERCAGCEEAFVLRRGELCGGCARLQREIHARRVRLHVAPDATKPRCGVGRYRTSRYTAEPSVPPEPGVAATLLHAVCVMGAMGMVAWALLAGGTRAGLRLSAWQTRVQVQSLQVPAR